VAEAINDLLRVRSANTLTKPIRIKPTSKARKSTYPDPRLSLILRKKGYMNTPIPMAVMAKLDFSLLKEARWGFDM